jgi:Ca2+-binding RTX toxin-like protein
LAVTDEDGDAPANDDATLDITLLPEINGTEGPDVLSGDGSDEIINGLGGADTITGNGGDDILSGGDGADTFLYVSVLDGNDIITDFVNGTDTIDLDGLLDDAGIPNVDRNSTTGDINIDNSGTDAVVTVTGVADFSITVLNVDLADADFNYGTA